MATQRNTALSLQSPSVELHYRKDAWIWSPRTFWTNQQGSSSSKHMHTNTPLTQQPKKQQQQAGFMSTMSCACMQLGAVGKKKRQQMVKCWTCHDLVKQGHGKLVITPAPKNNNCIRAENEVITVVLYGSLQDRLAGNRLLNNMFYPGL